MYLLYTGIYLYDNNDKMYIDDTVTVTKPMRDTSSVVDPDPHGSRTFAWIRN